MSKSDTIDRLVEQWSGPHGKPKIGWRPLKGTNQYNYWSPLKGKFKPLHEIAQQRKQALQKKRSRDFPSAIGGFPRALEAMMSGTAFTSNACHHAISQKQIHFHCYPIPKSANHRWSTWYRCRLDGETIPWTWHCKSFLDASRNFSWDENELWPLAAALQSAMHRGDQSLTAVVAFQILKWGGLDGPRKNPATRDWIMKNATSNRLIKKIIDATLLLSPYSNEPLSDFNGEDLMVDSGLTKIYAAVAMHLSSDTQPKQDVLIYDGRVGSALGLLARNWLSTTNEKKTPPRYAFPWSGDEEEGSNNARRNPSGEKFKFPRLHNGPARQERRADMTRFAAKCLQEALHVRGPSRKFLDAEKALFMIGYDVRGLCCNCPR